jgi:hypothetical protein
MFSRRARSAAYFADTGRLNGGAIVAAVASLARASSAATSACFDFALWATACETALWPAGTFWSAFCGNRDEAVAGVIDADPVAAAVRGVMAARTEWTGTASDLLGALAQVAGVCVAKSMTWPDSPEGAGGPVAPGGDLPAQDRHRDRL